MDLASWPDDALAQSTRARLFGLLTQLRKPAATEELASRLDPHPNGVRVHLERLRGAGLVARERTRQARGRPRDMWLIAPGARPGGEAPSGYRELGRWLARVISPSKGSIGAVEATGREIGGELAPDGDCAPEEKMYAVLTSLGFQPHREAGPADRLTYGLRNCPYRDAVRESPEVVCSLHRGIARGLLDALAPDTKLAAFVPHDPNVAGCLIQLQGGLAVQAVERPGESA
jgi:predicted ArsR family transcriptional regulator